MMVVMITRIVFSSLFFKTRILYCERLTTVGFMGEDVGDVAIVLETIDSERYLTDDHIHMIFLLLISCTTFCCAFTF